jgi:two-component system NtrC family sensor kinase
MVMLQKEPPGRASVQELEMELSEERSLSTARNRLLDANIKELNDLYLVLKEKLQELRRRNEKIKRFEADLVQAGKLSALGEMAGSIAHEIKNPMISIQGFAERIEKTSEPEKVNRYARLIGREAQRLSKVIVSLLDFARRNEPKKERLNINDIVDETMLFMEHHLTRFKKVELVIEKAEQLPLVDVDKIQVQQTIVNIMINGAQAMPDGGRITVRTVTDGASVSILIADNGTGIRKDDMAKIFQPFFTTKDAGEGTGLGLPLCKKLIEANGGRIEVESAPGSGTTFTLNFPVPQ